MVNSKPKISYIAVNFLLFIFALLLQYNDSFTIKIATANPMLPLAVLVCFSMFASETVSALTGLVVGIFADSAAGTPVGFNTILFFVIALAVSLTVRYLFNNNYRSAIALNFSTLLYFTARWLLSFTFGGLQTSLGYIMRFAIPSIVYTLFFAVPLYYLQKFLAK